MDTEQMIELARTIQAEGVWTNVDGRNDDDVFAWVDALLAEHEARVAAEQERELFKRAYTDSEAWRVAAERERDDVLVALSAAQDNARDWKARVGTLEAALRFYADKRGNEGDRLVSDGGRIARAALGNQAAPTEPTDVEVVEFHMTHDGAAPQAAPEPERLYTQEHKL